MKLAHEEMSHGLYTNSR